MTRRLVILIILLLLCCSGIGLAAYLLRPPVFLSHPDVVAHLLEQDGLRVRKIDAAQPWPDSVNYYAYGSGVYPYNLLLTIELPDGKTVPGRIECRHDRYDCQLTIASLGIDRLEMPDIQSNSTLKLPGWLDQLLVQTGLR